MTYQGTIERTGAKFHLSVTEADLTAAINGTIDKTGNITAIYTLTSSGSSCDIPVTGRRT